MTDSVDIKVTRIGEPRPIVHPSIPDALRALAKIAEVHDRIGPSSEEARLAPERMRGRL